MLLLLFLFLLLILVLLLFLFLLVQRAPLGLYVNSGWPYSLMLRGLSSVGSPSTIFLIRADVTALGTLKMVLGDLVCLPRRGCPIEDEQEDEQEQEEEEEEEEEKENGRNITTLLLFMLYY